jgi:hypothetical protein
MVIIYMSEIAKVLLEMSKDIIKIIVIEITILENVIIEKY